MEILSNKILSSRYKANGKAILELNKSQTEALNAIKSKIDSSKYVFEAVDCLNCNSNGFDLIAEKDRYGLAVSTVICRECGLLQTNPRMNQNSYNDFYENHYRQLYSGNSIGTDVFFKNQHNHGKLIYDFIRQNINLEDLNIVEVGAGAGGILSFFKEKGFTVWGVDLGSSYVGFGKEKGIELFSGTIDVIFEKKIKPNLVIYSHVLEHILNPNIEIQKWYNYLDVGDMIYIEVPGLDNLTKNYRNDFLRYIQNAHTVHFNLAILESFMNKNGFDMVIGNENVQALFVKRELVTNKKKNNNYETVINILKKYESKRKNIFDSNNRKYFFSNVKNKSKRNIVSFFKNIGVYKFLKK